MNREKKKITSQTNLQITAISKVSWSKVKVTKRDNKKLKVNIIK